MTSIRNDRPYTNPWLKNPSYPTVNQFGRIVEMTWPERTGEWPQRLDRFTQQDLEAVRQCRTLPRRTPEQMRRLIDSIVEKYTPEAVEEAYRVLDPSPPLVRGYLTEPPPRPKKPMQ